MEIDMIGLLTAEDANKMANDMLESFEKQRDEACAKGFPRLIQAIRYAARCGNKSITHRCYISKRTFGVLMAAGYKLHRKEGAEDYYTISWNNPTEDKQ